MNRIILIGNGFDKAHNLPTRYDEFIHWYWMEWGKRLRASSESVEVDRLCSFRLCNIHDDWSHALPNHRQTATLVSPCDGYKIVEIVRKNRELCDFSFRSPFFQRICVKVENKKWVDIEDVFYSFLKSSNNPKNINDDLEFIKDKLVEYLSSLQDSSFNSKIQQQILSPISKADIAIGSKKQWEEIMTNRMNYDNSKWEHVIEGYNINNEIHPYSVRSVEDFKKTYSTDIIYGDVDESSCPTFRLPDNIMLLNFNYTNTADMYLPKVDKFSVNHIHGTISKPETVIFGYGDEKDEEYKVLMKKNDDEYLRHIKSFRYLETSNYRKMLAFIESAPYQLCIMGHSCGISDRTLLSTLFEHDNCISIKPYYHLKEDGTDNYRELVFNIARNFSDPRLMRDRVVGKERCEPLGK